jgi:AraC-like DNA-binding protein
MISVFAADDVPAASRGDYWRHILGEALVPLEPIGPSGGPAGLRLVAGRAGPVTVTELSHTGRGGAARTVRHIRRSDPDLCKIDVLARGRGVIQQGGREAELRAGDIALVDLSRPATWAMSGTDTSTTSCLAVVFPRALLPLRPDQLGRLAAVRIPGDRGAGALISSLARQLPRHLDSWDAASGARIGSAVLHLFTVAVAGLVDRTSDVAPESRRQAVLLRTYALIEERLADPGLTPAALAAAQFVSVRYLHKLFETQHTTLAEWIRRRRLERCARDLLDPALTDSPISAVAARWGLANPAHFSRLFRSRYGVSPSEYRAAGERDPVDQPLSTP